MKSPAVVNFAPEAGSVELREVAKPEPGENDVIDRFPVQARRLHNQSAGRWLALGLQVSHEGRNRGAAW